MKKHIIVRVNHDFTTKIEDVFLSHKDAIEYLSNMLNTDYKTEDKQKYYKIYYESNNEITINYCGWGGRTLHAKWFIIEYEDETDTKKCLDFIKSKV